jgi:Flp pilus assembly protein TadG
VTNPNRRTIDIRSEQGQSLTEFALALPVLALLLFAVIQFGIVFNNYVTLTDATRAGARKAIVSKHESDPAGLCMQAVRNSAQDLEQSDLDTSCQSTWTDNANVTVTATYPYEISLLGMVVKSGRLSSTTQERME